jgi:hypothetical protein
VGASFRPIWRRARGFLKRLIFIFAFAVFGFFVTLATCSTCDISVPPHFEDSSVANSWIKTASFTDICVVIHPAMAVPEEAATAASTKRGEAVNPLHAGATAHHGGGGSDSKIKAVDRMSETSAGSSSGGKRSSASRSNAIAAAEAAAEQLRLEQARIRTAGALRIQCAVRRHRAQQLLAKLREQYMQMQRVLAHRAHCLRIVCNLLLRLLALVRFRHRFRLQSFVFLVDVEKLTGMKVSADLNLSVLVHAHRNEFAAHDTAALEDLLPAAYRRVPFPSVAAMHEAGRGSIIRQRSSAGGVSGAEVSSPAHSQTAASPPPHPSGVEERGAGLTSAAAAAAASPATTAGVQHSPSAGTEDFALLTGSLYRTKIISRTGAPVWNECAIVTNANSADMIVLTVVHRDAANMDHFLGEVRLTFGRCSSNFAKQ